jgi:acetylornithine deacetylase
MGNLISTVGADTSGKSLMLITNAMNQPAATMQNAYAGDVADGAPFGLSGEVVLGKGASEQKANMAAMLVAMEAVLRGGHALAGRLVHICCVSGETGSHAAIRSVVEGEGVRADLAYLGGTSLMMTLGNRGRIDIFITVHGAPTHSSRPEDGANAITGAMEVIRRLGDIKLDQVHPALGRQSLTVNRIRSFPESTHTIQASCDLTIDRRLLPGEDPDAAFAEIAAAARSVEAWPDPASGKPFRVEVTLGPFMYPSLVATDAEVVRELFAASRLALGTEPATFCAPNAFDQGYLNHVGIPTVNWGPGEYKFAHTDFDLAAVDRVRDAALVFAVLILRRLG